MTDKCDKNDLKYLFFDMINNIFVDKIGKKLVNLKPNLSNFSPLNSGTNINFNAYQKME